MLWVQAPVTSLKGFFQSCKVRLGLGWTMAEGVNGVAI